MMLLDRKILCFNSLFAFAVAWTGPSNLRARTARDRSEFATIEVQWDGAFCNLVEPIYKVFVAKNDSDPSLVGETQFLELQIPQMRFWTDYTIILKPGSPCFEKELTLNYFSGPGKVERPKNIIVESKLTDVNWAIEFLPDRKWLHNYLLEFTADSHTLQVDWRTVPIEIKDNWFNSTIPSFLLPGTHYEIKFFATWLYEREVYSSPDIFLELDTENFIFPPPINFRSNGSVQSADTTEVTVEWDLDQPASKLPSNLQLAYFNVSLFCSNGYHSFYKTERAKITFEDLAPNAFCKTTVNPVYQMKIKFSKSVEVFNSFGEYIFRCPVTGPFDLTGKASSAPNGFVDIELRWNHGSCRGIYEIYAAAENKQLKLAATTKNNHVKLAGYEYFTNYSIEVKSGAPCPNSSLDLTVSTGPGKPHQIENLIVRPVNENSVEIAIKEAALMPILPDVYIVNIESIFNKTSLSIKRVHDKVDNGWLNLTLNDITKPDTHYKVGVGPVISLHEDLQGDLFYREFDTDE